MAVKLKFRCTEVAQIENWNRSGGPLGRVKLNPVSANSDENKAFYEATPGGSLDFSTVNAEAIKQFEPGKEFYITLEEVPAAA